MPALRRAITGPMLFLFVLGDVLGAGIYALVGQVADRVGGAVWSAFLAALLLALLTAASYAELVTKHPAAAGAALYVNRAFRRPFVTFMVTFAVLASGVSSAATLARAFAGDYLGQFVALPAGLVGLAFLGALTAINLAGISESVRANVLLTLVELTGLLLVVVVGAAAIAAGTGDPGRALEFRHAQPVPRAVLSGAGLAFFALIGFEDSVNLAEETRDPRRSFPRALFGGLLAAGAIYVAVSVVASMTVPTARLARSGGPLLEVVREGPLAVPPRVFSAIALFALANGALINLLMGSRLLYGMAREGILPPALGRVGARRQTPGVAIAVTGAAAAALFLSGSVASLAETTVVLLLLVFAGVNAACLALRRERVGHDHFRAPRIVPVLGAGVSLALLTAKDPVVLARAGALLLAGAALWLASSRLSAARRPAARARRPDRDTGASPAGGPRSARRRPGA